MLNKETETIICNMIDSLSHNEVSLWVLNCGEFILSQSGGYFRNEPCIKNTLEVSYDFIYGKATSDELKKAILLTHTAIKAIIKTENNHNHPMVDAAICIEFAASTCLLKLHALHSVKHALKAYPQEDVFFFYFNSLVELYNEKIC